MKRSVQEDNVSIIDNRISRSLSAALLQGGHLLKAIRARFGVDNRALTTGRMEYRR